MGQNLKQGSRFESQAAHHSCTRWHSHSRLIAGVCQHLAALDHTPPPALLLGAGPGEGLCSSRLQASALHSAVSLACVQRCKYQE